MDQENHRLTKTIKRKKTGGATNVEIRPLNEDMDVQDDLIGEAFLFSVNIIFLPFYPHVIIPYQKYMVTIIKFYGKVIYIIHNVFSYFGNDIPVEIAMKTRYINYNRIAEILKQFGGKDS